MTQDKLVALRETFDRAFAAAPETTRERSEDLLAIRISDDERGSYALRVGEIVGLAVDRRVVSFPSVIDDLLGVAGLRGGLLPVYSLAALLGHGRPVDPGRWLAVCGTVEPVGLAFSDFEGYRKIPTAQVFPSASSAGQREHVSEVARTAEEVRAIVSIPSILAAITRRCGEARASKER